MRAMTLAKAVGVTMLNASEEWRHAMDACDREAIHTPGSIQPHGVMLVARAHDWLINGTAGDVSEYLDVDPDGSVLVEVIGKDCFARIGEFADGGISNLERVKGKHGPRDAIAFPSGEHVVVELEVAEELSLPDASSSPRLWSRRLLRQDKQPSGPL
jgi:light-regulated signal transduction histidine kinase (bacteriophytochrome)